jgi:hypothetical protein
MLAKNKSRIGDVEEPLSLGQLYQFALLVTIERAILKTTIIKRLSKNANIITKKHCAVKRLPHTPNHDFR